MGKFLYQELLSVNIVFRLLLLDEDETANQGNKFVHVVCTHAHCVFSIYRRSFFLSALFVPRLDQDENILTRLKATPGLDGMLSLSEIVSSVAQFLSIL